MFGQQQIEEEAPVHEEGLGKEHHSFKAAHHERLAKLHHMIAKTHEAAAAHHSKMAGDGAEDAGLDDEGTDTVQNTSPMSFGRGAR